MTNETTPLCSHFNICGGCKYQDLSYPETQIENKKEFLTSLFDQEVEIIPSPKAYEYRNRMDFVCAFGKIGLRKRKQYKEVVNIDHCFLAKPEVSELLEYIRGLIKKYDINSYNYITHNGYLRYTVFRVPEFTNDLMVSFVTASEDEKILPLMEELAKKVTTVNWIINDTLSDVSFGRLFKVIGKEYFEEKVGSYTYKIGPNTFCQNNASLANQFFEEIKKHVSGKVLDLCCGMGAISIYVADRVESVLGIELEPESIRLANENKVLNNVSNVEFVALDAKRWLLDNRDLEGTFDTIILDPPRAGLGQKVARKVRRFRAERIVYASCNPKSLKDDMKAFEEFYKMDFIKGFDMFPQTPHVEVVAVFNRLNPSKLTD